MPKKKFNYSEQRIRRPVSFAILAVTAAVIFLACFLRLSWPAVPQDGAADAAAAVLSAVSAVAVMLFFSLYLYFCERGVFGGLKKLLTVCTLTALSSALGTVISLVSPCFTAALLAVILTGTLIKGRLAYASALVTAAVAGTMAAGTDEGPFVIMLSLTLGGFASAFVLNLKKSRILPILAGVAGGAVAALVYTCVNVFAHSRFSDMLMPAVWLFASALLCGIIAAGLMPVFENVFDISTDARLNELMNNNNPLLKRLMLEAPGTYHHSMLVAALAESAAEAIGADPLLCKAAGYYHDVGKLRSPMHFRENQRDYNIHDDLPPLESAQRIIAHQSDGVALMLKHKLPIDVIRVAAEHHGDSLVVFFYSKALQQSPDEGDVDEADYHYKAQKPSSRESGILMLADCCEAAVRSIKQPTRELIETKVRDVIGNLWFRRGGVLSECPLTARDISTIENCFINTLAAQYHERIEYPAFEEAENGK